MSKWSVQSKWQVTALGEAQLDSGVGGAVNEGFNPNVTGPNPDNPPDAGDNANNSFEQEVALATWVDMAVDLLNQGIGPDLVKAKLSEARCPVNQVEEVLIRAMEQPPQGIDDQAGQDAFASKPMTQEPQPSEATMPPTQPRSAKVYEDLWGNKYSLEQNKPDTEAIGQQALEEIHRLLDEVDALPAPTSRENIEARISTIIGLRTACRTALSDHEYDVHTSVYVDKLATDAQLALLNLRGRADDYGDHLSKPYRYDGFDIVSAEVDDSWDMEDAHIIASEVAGFDEENIREYTAARNPDPELGHVVVRLAKQYEIPAQATEKTASVDVDNDGPAESLFL